MPVTRTTAFTLAMVFLALGGLGFLFYLLNGCALHNPVPCDPSPDCPCGPCGVVETVAKDAGRDR